MTRRNDRNWCLAAVTALVLATGSPAALAEKPDWAGGGKHKQKDDGGRGGDRHAGKHKARGEHREARVGRYFDDRDRQALRVSWGEAYGGGRGCPPGLARKNNGCMPPGQARKYNVGQPLPATVVYYPVPATVTVHLPPPPLGHKYVRVAADILLIAVGTSMVVDAVTDLGRL